MIAHLPPFLERVDVSCYEKIDTITETRCSYSHLLQQKRCSIPLRPLKGVQLYAKDFTTVCDVAMEALEIETSAILAEASEDTTPPPPPQPTALGPEWPSTFGRRLQKELIDLEQQGVLYDQIFSCREHILENKEEWRDFVAAERERDPDTYAEIPLTGTLERIPFGCGGSYILEGEEGKWVVKPVDDDIYTLNNARRFGSPYFDTEGRHRTRLGVPLYRQPRTDVAVSELAKLWGMSDITPEAKLVIMDSEEFFDVSEAVPEEYRDEFIEKTGKVDKEKLCSVQRYCEDAVPLTTMLYELSEEGFTTEEIAEQIDRKDFEKIILFILLTYDTDAHLGNIMAYKKPPEKPGDPETIGLIKIDNGLSLPEENIQLRNSLVKLSLGLECFSPETIQEYLDPIDVGASQEVMEHYGLEGAKRPFAERVELLHECVAEGLSMREISKQLAEMEVC